jgi:hypothetical protein
MNLFGFNSNTNCWEFIAKLVNYSNGQLDEFHYTNLSLLFNKYCDFEIGGW